MAQNISIVVAMAKNRAIGKDNKLLWYLPNDLKYFKQITLNHPIVMGRKTFEAIGRPLPGRDNLVLTSDHNYKKDNIIIFSDSKKLLEYCGKNYNINQEIMIIGGAEIYNIFLKYAHKIYLTLVDTILDADTFFPELDPNIWREVLEKRVDNYIDHEHQYNYSFREYVRCFR
ncbi:MAG: dihydrofolate reductase [Burkholderiales bacterium]|nr:dihydrofolate reductase [Burkholderiales bacterium]